MKIPLDRVTEVARSVIAESGRKVELLSVLPNGGSERVELLITICGCHTNPCNLLLNITRTDETELEDELRDKLREALLAHANS